MGPSIRKRGDPTPRGTALVLLNIIAKEPKAAMKALADLFRASLGKAVGCRSEFAVGATPI